MKSSSLLPEGALAKWDASLKQRGQPGNSYFSNLHAPPAFQDLARKHLARKTGDINLSISKFMTAAEIFESVTNGGTSDFGEVVAALLESDIKWCLIGGLAVNCYVAPVYTADADFVVVTGGMDTLGQKLGLKGFKISRFEFSVNAQKPGSDLVMQFTRDERYQPFIGRAERREVFGSQIPVAALPDLLQGKIWAWQDPRRRLSKRTKDQADLIRIGEEYPELLHLLPDVLRRQLEEERKEGPEFGCLESG